MVFSCESYFRLVRLCSSGVLSVQMHMRPLKTEVMGPLNLGFVFWLFLFFYCEVLFFFLFISDFILHLCTEPSIVSECNVTLEEM